MKTSNWSVTASLVILIVGLTGCRYFGGRTPDRYLVPAGYKGPLLFEYNIKDAPPMRIEDGHYLIVFDAKGKAATSQKEPHNDEQGWARDEFLYVAPDGTRTPIPANLTHYDGYFEEHGWKKNKEPYTRSFKQRFIGTKQQFNKYFFPNSYPK